ncbi:hypothetical protein DPV78_011859 [Talaromyces pinophilus]|nr:hypothetical protein DPV78_011859 [Talaromyces pinophilus]
MVNPTLREASPSDISSRFDTASPYDTSQLWNAPTPSFPGTPRSPSNFSYVSSRHGFHRGYSTPHVPARLPLLGLDDWEEGRAYDEQPPICIHYSIEWKLALNKRLETRDTEQNLVLAPSAYWNTFLKPKLERLIAQKFSRDQRVRPDDTEVIIAINNRSEHNLTKRFEKTEIECTRRCKRLEIPGPRDVALRNYSEWHASNVDDYELKNDYRKACQVALENGLDLQQIFNRPDQEFFTDRKVKIGTANRFVDADDILDWVENYMDHSQFD